jgi:hypothetical protein
MIKKYTLPYSAAGYDCMNMNDDYIYVRSHSPWGSSILDQNTGDLVQFVLEPGTEDQARSRWWLSNGALYAFRNFDETKETVLFKHDKQGNYEWNSTIPMFCYGSGAGYVAANSRYVYAICGIHSGITQFDINNGLLIRYFGSNKKNAREMKTSEDSFFPYYEEEVEQYSSQDADLISSYSRSLDDGHQYPILRITKNFVFYNVQNSKTTVLQWKIKKKTMTTQVDVVK